MYDMSQQFNTFYRTEVVLSAAEQNSLREKRKRNIKRLKDGLLEYNEEHGTEYKYRQHRGHGDEGGIEKAHEKALGPYGIFIIFKSSKGLSRRQLKGRTRTDGALHLEGIYQHHEYGIHIEHGDHCHDYTPEPVGKMSLFTHCCTSFSLVTLSWIREMATTMMQNITALAWPMPLHWGPERP